MKGISKFFTASLFISLFAAALVFAQTKTTQPTKKEEGPIKEEKQKEEVKDTSQTKSVAFGGQFLGNLSVYIEAEDLIKFNIRYYSKVVHTYAYFVSRPHKLKLVFKDYKNNHLIIHLNNANLLEMPNLYADKLYEIRARVGNVKNGKLHMKSISMQQMFLERKYLDR